MEDFEATCCFDANDIMEAITGDDGKVEIIVMNGAEPRSSVLLTQADATRLRDWLNQWLERQDGKEG